MPKGKLIYDLCQMKILWKHENSIEFHIRNHNFHSFGLSSYAFRLNAFSLLHISRMKFENGCRSLGEKKSMHRFVQMKSCTWNRKGKWKRKRNSKRKVGLRRRHRKKVGGADEFFIFVKRILSFTKQKFLNYLSNHIVSVMSIYAKQMEDFLWKKSTKKTTVIWKIKSIKNILKLKFNKLRTKWTANYVPSCSNCQANEITVIFPWKKYGDHWSFHTHNSQVFQYIHFSFVQTFFHLIKSVAKTYFE